MASINLRMSWGYLILSVCVLMMDHYKLAVNGCEADEYSTGNLSQPGVQYCATCGHCVSLPCAAETGACDSLPLYPGAVEHYLFRQCQNGWTTDQCTKPCPRYFYGFACRERCGNCLKYTCDHITGECRACKSGYSGSKCNRQCKGGSFGNRCLERCGSCYNGASCNHSTGNCIRCQAGFIMPLCSTKCLSGTYGQECNQTCGHCGQGSACDSVTGDCKICERGYQPPKCTRECEDGFYGTDCKKSCGACAMDELCNKRSGFCSGGCDRDTAPPLCQNKRDCGLQYYGRVCDQKCGKCTYPPCDEITGHCHCPPDPDVVDLYNDSICHLCLLNYKPPFCQEMILKVRSSKQFVLVLAVSLGVAFTLLALLVAGGLWLTRRKRRKHRGGRRMTLQLQVPEANERRSSRTSRLKSSASSLVDRIRKSSSATASRAAPSSSSHHHSRHEPSTVTESSFYGDQGYADSVVSSAYNNGSTSYVSGQDSVQTDGTTAISGLSRHRSFGGRNESASQIRKSSSHNL